jgi:hypothetical protein
MSGQGRVAQVAVFEDGSAALRWLAARNAVGTSSTVIYESVLTLLWVHRDKKTGHLEHVYGDDPTMLCRQCFRAANRADGLEPDEGRTDALVVSCEACGHDMER